MTKYDKMLSKLQSANSRTQDNINLKEAWGFTAATGDYRKLNRNLQSQISTTIKQRKELIKLRSTVKKGTEEWYRYNERIEDSNASIRELTKTMAENATASAALAKAKADRKNSLEDSADERIDTQISAAPSPSAKNGLIGKKVKNIDDRHSNLLDAYGTSRKSRVKYGGKIQGASKEGVSKKNKALFKKATARAKSGKPIPSTLINSITKAMSSATGTEYKRLNALLSYCISYNSSRQAEEENRLAYEMYALAAQADKKVLRDEQLQNRMDKAQRDSERATLSNAESASAKNHNVDAQVKLADAEASSYTSAWKDAKADRSKAASATGFQDSRKYKKLGSGKLKNRLKKVTAAIKSGKEISSDGLDAVKEYCKKYLKGDLSYYYNCMAYNEAVGNEISAKEAETLAKAEAYASNLQAVIDKAGNTVSGRDAQDELYSATEGNQSTAEGKNAYVDKRIANIKKNLDTYKNSYSSLQSSYESARKTVTGYKGDSGNKVISEIKSKYVSKGILIPAGDITKAYGVSGTFGLACENYNEALEAKEAARAAYDLYQQTAKTEQSSLVLEKMSNIDQEYSNKASAYEHEASRINKLMDLNRAKGYQESVSYYEGIAEADKAVSDGLKKEHTELMAQLPGLEEGTDSWYEAWEKIYSIEDSIYGKAQEIQDCISKIRQIKWDNFDYMEDRIKGITSEVSFVTGELSRGKLTDDSTGGLTDKGEAVAMLHAANYETYREQAQDYKEEISKINKELADDPYNVDLLARKDALIQSYQDTVKAAQDEKYAVIDLYKQGYDALISKVRSLINEYSDLLDAEKNAFDYQKDIAGKAKEIADIRKQLEAYSGDVSEETRAKVQSLKVSLEEAEEALQDAQYDKYISDTKDMLSELGEDFETAIQELIDSLSDNFAKLQEDIAKNSADAANTVVGAMEEIDYIPSDDFRQFLAGIEGVGALGTDIKSFGSTVGAAVDRMVASTKAFCTEIIAAADRIAGNGIKEDPEIPKAPAIPPAVEDTPPASETSKQDNNKKDEGISLTDLPLKTGLVRKEEELPAGIPGASASEKAPGQYSALIVKADSYIRKHVSKTSTKRESLSDLNKKIYDNYGKKTLPTKHVKGLADILGVKYDNKKKSGTVYKKLKAIGLRGFRTGSPYIPYGQLAFLGEGGNELQFDRDKGVVREVGMGDKVFTNEMSENLWKLANADPGKVFGTVGLPKGMPDMAKASATMPDGTASRGMPGDVNIDISNITMHEVNDPKAFTSNLLHAISTDRNVKGMLVNETVGKLTKGYNSLSGRKFMR